MRNRYSRLLLLFILIALPVALFAQGGPAAGGGIKANLPTIIVGIAAAVFSLLQLVKQFIPISGWVVVVLNILLSVIGTYAAAPPDHVLSFQFLISTILASLGASGIWAKYQAIKPAT